MKRFLFYIIGLVVSLVTVHIFAVDPVPSSQVLQIDWEGVARDGDGNIIDNPKLSKACYLLYPLSMQDKISAWNCNHEEGGFGPFTVGETVRPVYFAPGNLQYRAGGNRFHECSDGSMQPGEWRFAVKQWDYIGFFCDCKPRSSQSDVRNSSNSKISENYEGWIDLFGWGTSGWYNYKDRSVVHFYPWSSDTLDGYGPQSGLDGLFGNYAQYDWGVYNVIESYPPGTWRCLTSAEWDYILNKRARASELRSWVSIIHDSDTIVGLALLPDNCDITFSSGYGSFPTTTIDSSEWVDLYERQYQAVFLPMGSVRIGIKSLLESQGKDEWCNIFGGYWSSSCGDIKSCATGVQFLPTDLSAPTDIIFGIKGDIYRYAGFSVRLVR